MALIKKVRGHEPVIGENTFLAETAVILGDVTIGRDCSVWYNAVLRGDVNRIAQEIQKIVDELGGLPPVKIHCSVLAEHAIKSAIYDYAQKNGKYYKGLEGFDPDAEDDDHHDVPEEDE